MRADATDPPSLSLFLTLLSRMRCNFVAAKLAVAEYTRDGKRETEINWRHEDDERGRERENEDSRHDVREARRVQTRGEGALESGKKRGREREKESERALNPDAGRRTKH